MAAVAALPQAPVGGPAQAWPRFGPRPGAPASAGDAAPGGRQAGQRRRWLAAASWEQEGASALEKPFLAEVAASQSAAAVLGLLDARLGQLSGLAAVAALSRLARLVDAEDTVGATRLRALAAPSLVQPALPAAAEAAPRGLASTAWACAKLALRDRPLLDSISAAAIRMLPEFNPLDLSMTAWSFAHLGV